MVGLHLNGERGSTSKEENSEKQWIDHILQIYFLVSVDGIDDRGYEALLQLHSFKGGG